jgi:hypothetical protein
MIIRTLWTRKNPLGFARLEKINHMDVLPRNMAILLSYNIAIEPEKEHIQMNPRRMQEKTTRKSLSNMTM